ncbi:hypothetical protein ABZ620_05335 [Nocardiopsis alba]|uniref:hypothetical protein n=1 Tax=Nocardiopsis alba TaxID=53437 RepID=UPI0034006C5E
MKLKKFNRHIGVILLASSLSLSTASGALAIQTPKDNGLDSLGTSGSNDEISSGLSAEANSAERSESSSVLSVTWSIENSGDSDAYFTWPNGSTYMYNDPLFYSGVTIKSTEENKRYHPIMDSSGECLCSGNASIDFKERIRPGEQVAYWSMFSVPSDVDTITLEIPGFDPIEDIPIS